MKATLTEVTKRLTVEPRKQEGILGYDADNNYPERVRNIVAASSMGKGCLSTYRKFIYGRGFSDVAFAKTKLNRWGVTADKILAKITSDFALFGGFALHVNWNAAYQITDISYQPFSYVRITTSDSDKAGMYAVSKNWGDSSATYSRKKKGDVLYIDKFTTKKELIDEQVRRAGGWNNWKGQIYYFSGEGEQYPVALYDAALEDMQTDAQTKTYKFRNVTSNFMASHVLLVDKIESAGPEDGNDGSGSERSKFVEVVEEYQGADNAQKIMIIEKDAPDQTVELKKVEQQTGDRLFEYTEGSTRDNIRQAFLLPGVLLMLTPGKLGTNQEVIDATKYYNTITEDERLAIEDVFNDIVPISTIPNSGDFSIKERESVRREDIATKDVVDIASNDKLTVEQKRGLLKAFYMLDEETINTIVPVAAPAPAPAMPAATV